jgi:hypothetical protein
MLINGGNAAANMDGAFDDNDDMTRNNDDNVRASLVSWSTVFSSFNSPACFLVVAVSNAYNHMHYHQYQLLSNDNDLWLSVMS